MPLIRATQSMPHARGTNGNLKKKSGTATSICAAAIAAGCYGSACAQTASGAPAPAPLPSTGLEEVIVTASRRSQSVQRESRVIDVVSGKSLVRHAVVDVVDVQKLVPGVTIARSGPQLQVNINGVGDRTITAQSDPAVALNLDGIYYPKGYEATGSFYDLERIEVLKGPQGTLYGRNASAGAVNIITAKPARTLGGFVEVEFGNYGDKRITGAINAPVSDTVDVRLSGQVVERDGYLTDGYNDDKTQGGRLQIRWTPTDIDTLLLSTSYSHLGGKGDAEVLLSPLGGNPWAGPSSPAVYNYVAQNSPPGFANLLASNGSQDIQTYVASAQYQHIFDNFTLTVLPSFVRSQAPELNYSGVVTPVYENTTSNQYSIETRLSSPAAQSGFKWVVGAFASQENAADYDETELSPAFYHISAAPVRRDRTAAVFAEATYSVTNRLRVTGGVRGTFEDKKVVGTYVGVGGPIPVFPIPEDALPIGTASIGGMRTDRAVNFRAGVEYDLLPRSLLYANYATGFKAGGFYDDVAPNSYKPEELSAYTVGIKNRFLDNRLQINADAFYWDYRDKQETFIGFSNDPALGIVLETKNAGRATIYGGDVSVDARLSPQDTLTGQVAFLRTKYDSFDYTTANPGGLPNTACAYTLAGPNANINCSGFVLPRAPIWSGRFGFEHVIPLGDTSSLTLNADVRFSDTYYLATDYIPLEHAGPYHVTDFSAAWAINKRYTITGFIQNIENTAVYDGAQAGTFIPNKLEAQIEAPRTYGVRLRASF